MPDEPTKRCRDCKDLLPLSAFYRNQMSKDGRQSYCKICHRARTAAYKQKNPMKGAKHQRDYYQRRKQKVAAEVEANTSWI